MATPLISEVMPWPGVFAPRTWAFCQGQLLAISQNDALFSLIGTIYGGDGRTTFGLPDLRGRAAVGQGQGPGLSPYPLGARYGTEFVTLNSLELPAHNHSAQFNPSGTTAAQVSAVNASANQESPAGNYLAAASTGDLRSPTAVRLYSDQTPNATVGGLDVGGGGTVTVGNTGGSQSHENRMPFQVINFCIALYGLYPQRN
jgi:microcystin-dependent protein